MYFARRVQTNLMESPGVSQSWNDTRIVHDLAFNGEMTPVNSKGNSGLCQPIVIGERSEA